LLATADHEDDDDDDSGLIVHPGDDPDDDHPNPRAPRTPNRVRFDLRPTIVSDPRRSNGSADDSHDNPYPHPRESFDLDSADPLSHTPSSHSHHGQRVPLLTGIEAPSVTVATTNIPDDGAESYLTTELSRPKSSLPSAFMNMANSIIGAGIIGQPYAFRQAGLLSGTLLLIILTVVVDWTIRLIVVNSKLSGSTSFQGTVERCFGRTGLVAISVAQWAFAFGGMVAFGVIVGDSIPSVLRAVWPGIRDKPGVGWIADRRVVIVVFTLGVSYPLALYRDIAKVSFLLSEVSGGFGGERGHGANDGCVVGQGEYARAGEHGGHCGDGCRAGHDGAGGGQGDVEGLAVAGHQRWDIPGDRGDFIR
jgi:sodium-coupled neutral amino acid transporter 11